MNIRYVVSSFCITMVFSLIYPFFSLASIPLDIYIGAKIMGGAGSLSVGNYAQANGTLIDGKIAEDASSARWGGGLVVGIRYPITSALYIRGELEYLRGRMAKTFRTGGETKLALNSNTMLLNTYLDLNLLPLIKPYISLGAGFAYNELKYTPSSIDVGSVSTTLSTPIVQGGIGAYIQLSPVALDFNLRYLYTFNIERTYVNSSGVGFRRYSSSGNVFEAILSILYFF